MDTHLKDKGGEDVENDNDGEEVESDEEESGPPGAYSQHKSLRHDMPLVDHQEVKEYDHRPGHIVEVIGTVAILTGKKGFFGFL